MKWMILAALVIVGGLIVGTTVVTSQCPAGTCDGTLESLLKTIDARTYAIQNAQSAMGGGDQTGNYLGEENLNALLIKHIMNHYQVDENTAKLKLAESKIWMDSMKTTSGGRVSSMYCGIASLPDGFDTELICTGPVNNGPIPTAEEPWHIIPVGDPANPDNVVYGINGTLCNCLTNQISCSLSTPPTSMTYEQMQEYMADGTCGQIA